MMITVDVPVVDVPALVDESDVAIGPKMDPVVKRRWVNALRSKRYRQGRGRLRRDDEFCCLGVLCDIVEPDGWRFEHGRYQHYDTVNVLSNSVRVAAGMTRIAPYVSVRPAPGETRNCSLVVLNDHMGWSFDEIADIIDAQL